MKNKINLIIIIIFIIFLTALAATNIDSSNRWAWNDLIGWIDFYSTNTVNVNSQQLTGYASSSAGDISLDCATTRNGNICSQSNYKVLNDGGGNLSGWAWNDNYGWISFCGGQGNSNCPGSTIYQVKINPTTGDFSNYAWNDLLGWISFCGQPGGGSGCASTTYSYKVNTSWRATATIGYLDSSIYDTGISGGAQINSILWKGDLPSGTQVRFKIASSNSSNGPWNFLGPNGTTNDNDYYGPVLPNKSYPVNYLLHSNHRYFRYRVILVSDQAQRYSPLIDDIIINWSP
ncbi:MAG: hypothetical protein N2Z85_03285 [Patescibacteria group bacterium]|nr:hypothetical protein [Patescibacteria group bacterium]